MSRYYLLIGILLSFGYGYSQSCAVNGDINIPDNGRTYNVKIEANTSNAGGRVLCGVRLAFEHEFADEMQFVLVSPSGKQITLIATKPASSRTSGSSWNILFVRPDDTASPDDFKKPNWEENKWNEDQEYIGSYYPTDDKGLSYFDGDQLTGTWNLLYSDKVEGGKGILKSFRLIFCNPPVFCNPCQISRDFLVQRDYGAFCGGDAALRNLQPSIKEGGIQPGYEYTFMVLGRRNRVVLRGLQPDLSTLPAGTYQIIAVQYRPDNRDLIAGIKDRNGLSNLFYGNKSGLCGAYTKSSNEVTILSDPGVQNINLDVYGRDFVLIDGQEFRSSQAVTQTYTDQHGCDSLVRIQIEFKDYNPVFNQDEIYNCENTSIEVSVETDPEFTVNRWFTEDGKISNQSNIKSNQITVDAPGTYYVVFEIEDYLDTVSYMLRTDPGAPVIFLSNEYQLCSATPLNLSIGANYDTAIVKPSSKATISGNSLTIREPDLFTIHVRKGSCEITKHVLVQPSTSGETIQIDDVALSCPTDSIMVSPDLPGSFEHYSWIFQEREIANTKNLSTDKPGLYVFRAFDGNECGISGTVWVQDNISNVDLQISGPELINCNNIDKENRLSADYNGDFEAIWTLPGGTTMTGNNIPVDGDGQYVVRITDISGCTFADTHNISTNTQTINFSVPDEVIIPCNSSSAPVTAEVDASSDSYEINWSGASRKNPKNTAMVNEPGTVRVSVTHKVSRCTQSKNIIVRNEPGKPELSYDPKLDRAITCDSPTRILPVEINNCTNCEFSLSTDKDIVWENMNLIASEPGNAVIELNNGTCVTNRSITFPDKREARALRLDVENIGCNDKRGHIKVSNAQDYSLLEFRTEQDTFIYSGPITNITSPVSYTVMYIDKANGCTGSRVVEVIADSEPPAIDYESEVYLECNSGLANLSVQGKGISRIVWFDPDKNELPEKNTNFQVSKPGEYRFVAYDENLCFQDLTIEVKDDRTVPEISLDPEYSLPCDETTSGITPSYDSSGLASVIWYGPGGWSSTQFFPNLTPGEYRLLAIGKNGCRVSKKTRIIQQSPGVPPKVIAPPITCRSAYSRVYLEDYSGVEEVQWIDESGQASLSDSFDVYNPGRIYLTIKQRNGCLITEKVTVTEDKEKVSFTINEPVINCHTLQPTLRTKVSDSSGRQVFYRWYSEKSIVGQEADFDIKYPGEYRVEVSYDNGCIDSLSHIVRLDTTAIEIALEPDTISCSRSKIQLRKSIKTNPIAKASWTGPAGFSSSAKRPSFQMPGLYRLSYVGENGCRGESEMEIFGDVIPPKVDSVSYLSLGCNGKEVDLTYHTQDSVTTQYWQLPDGQDLEDSVVQITAKGNYILYLEGDNGCARIDTYNIENTVNPVFELEVRDADCIDQTGHALFLPDLDTFISIWKDPTTMNEIARGPKSPALTAGSYLVTAVNPLNGCDTTTVFEIKDITDILEATITIDDSLRCERSQANLISSVFPRSDHYVYEWRYGTQLNAISQDSVATDISREGLYTFIATDTVNNCIALATYNNVRAPSRLRSFDLFLTEPACDLNRAGYAIIDSVKGASDMSQMTYSLNNGPYKSQDTFPFLYANESYQISVKDQYGCKLDTLLLPELRGVMDRIGHIPDTTINSGDTINFNDPAFKLTYSSPDAPMSEQYTWILNPDTMFCDYDCTDKIQKQLYSSRTITSILTNQYGCKLTDTFNVHVREGDVLNLPNGIIPASSNPANAHACVYTNKYVSSIDLYVVFNRLGKVVFRRSDFDPRAPDQNFVHCWNGRDSQDRIYPSGNYNYYVRYTTVYGETKERYGNIFLVR